MDTAQTSSPALVFQARPQIAPRDRFAILPTARPGASMIPANAIRAETVRSADRSAAIGVATTSSSAGTPTQRAFKTSCVNLTTSAKTLGVAFIDAPTTLPIVDLSTPARSLNATTVRCVPIPTMTDVGAAFPSKRVSDCALVYLSSKVYVRVDPEPDVGEGRVTPSRSLAIHPTTRGGVGGVIARSLRRPTASGTRCSVSARG